MPKLTPVLATCLALASCAASAQRSKVVQSADTQCTSIECIQAEIINAKGVTHQAFQQLEAICAPQFTGNLRAACVDLTASTELAAQQASKLRTLLEDLRREGPPSFGVSPVCYEEVLRCGGSALLAYETLNTALRDRALFLKTDPSVGSAADLRSDFDSVRQAIDALDERFDECLLEALCFLESTGAANQAPVTAGPP